MISIRNTSLVVPELDLLPREISVLKNSLGARRLSPPGEDPFYVLPKKIFILESLLRDLPRLEWSPEVREYYQDPFIVNSISEKHLYWDTLLPYQQDAVGHLFQSPGSVLALSPGLGKTAVSIITSELLGARKVLVVAPLSLLYTWQREYEKWSQYLYPTLIYRDLTGSVLEEGWTITNYDLVSRHPTNFKQKWDLIILDESVMVKNRQTKRFLRLKTLVPQATRVWALSGSPVTKAVDDLWSQFHLLSPTSFTSYWRFAQNYCIIERTPWGDTIVGSKPYDFTREFRDMMFVRNQKDVLDLPDAFYETIELDLLPDQARLYKEILKQFIIELSSGEHLKIESKVAQLTRLLQVASNSINIDSGRNSSSKVEAVLELLETQYVENPTLIWTYWKPGSKVLYETLLGKGYSVGLVNGDTPQEMRDTILTKYRQGEYKILILSLAVGKYGLTLTNTRTMIYFDKTFSMDDYIQSFHRARRLGLDHSIFVVSLYARGTVDSLVKENLTGKSFDLARITDADLIQLLKSLGRNL